MSIYEQIIKDISKNSKSLLTESEVHMEDDGLLHCNVCGGQRQTIVNNMKVPCICKCIEKRIEQDNERERKAKQQAKYERLFRNSLMGDKYRTVSFENTGVGNSKDYEHTYNRCKRYCEVAQEVLEQGIGIYLYGVSGNGKTRLTACMANYLLKKLYTVIFTNFSEISKQIRRSYESGGDSEYDFFNKLVDADFLFIDDFGTEAVSRNNQDTWLQEKVFDLINQRYNNNKPIIFTSNYSLGELVNQRGLALKTVDRIVEKCEVMHLQSPSFRMSKAKERERLF